MRRLLPWLLVLLLAAAYRGNVLGGAGAGVGQAGAAQLAHVVRVVDGDTIVVTVDGRQDRVRYIGMDTPESVKPGVPVQCYAEAASAENKRLVAGQEVRLVPDAEPRDRYGRMLAYVYRRSDGLFVNAELVRRGYARTLTIPPNVRFERRFAALAQVAQRAGRGLWSACDR